MMLKKSIESDWVSLDAKLRWNVKWEGNRINSGEEENAAGIPHRVWEKGLAVSCTD